MASGEEFEIDKIINHLVFEIQSEMDKEYQDSYDFIASKCVDDGKEKECEMSVLHSMEGRMNLINQMSKDLTLDKSIQSNP